MNQWSYTYTYSCTSVRPRVVRFARSNIPEEKWGTTRDPGTEVARSLYLSAREILLKKNETNILQNNNRTKIIHHFFICIIKDYVSESM